MAEDKRTLQQFAADEGSKLPCPKCGSKKTPSIEHGPLQCILSSELTIPQDWNRLVGTSYACPDCGYWSKLVERVLGPHESSNS